MCLIVSFIKSSQPGLCESTLVFLEGYLYFKVDEGNTLVLDIFAVSEVCNTEDWAGFLQSEQNMWLE